MLRVTNCINVYSDMNTWIDFCIILNDDRKLSQAEEIINKSYDEWWELPDAAFEPIADYIGRKLTENGIKFEIYFKQGEEEI